MNARLCNSNEAFRFYDSIVSTDDIATIRLAWNSIIQLLETDDFDRQIKEKIANWCTMNKSRDWIYRFLQSNIQVDRKTALYLLISMTS